MMPPDGPEDDRAKYHGALVGGPLPSPAPVAQSLTEPVSGLPSGDKKALPDTPAAMRARAPGGIAQLLVYENGKTRDGEPTFGLKVACSCQEDATPVVDLGVRYEKPDRELDLATNLRSGGPSPSSFLLRMEWWSYGATELADWLNRHRAHSGGLQLMIMDNTPYRIPWELFWLPARQESGLPDDCLGAVLPISRWLRVKSYWSQSVQPADVPVPQARGAVAAFVDDGMRHDRDILRDYHVKYAASMGELFRHLKIAEHRSVAMIYVGAHGVPGKEPTDFALGGYRLGRAVRLNDDLCRVRKPAAFVFLNGCNTGFSDADTRWYNDQMPRSFAVVFLRNGAAGVLATAGEVGNTEANQLAGKLFEHFRTDRDITIAEAVRRLRAGAAGEIKSLLEADTEPDDLDQNLLGPLYTFMYVYFGNPGMLVSIDANDGDSDTDEPDD